jgi:hypothetical protein
MAELPTYKNLEEKCKFFSNGEKESFIIDTKMKFNLLIQKILKK